MNYRTYQKIRSYCLQDVGQYLDTAQNNQLLKLAQKLAKSPPLAHLEHELDFAKGLYQCADLTPRENAAADVLAVVSNHRALAWWREPQTPDGTPPCLPLEPWQSARLELQTQQAVGEYAAFLPEREAVVLVGLVQTAPATDTQQTAPASETPQQRRTRYLAWLTEEQRINPRGALQRVVEREAKQKPNADRGNIGNDIRKAQATAKTQKQANAWTAQLVTDGKRKG